jgi:hypothetical protein
VAPVRVRTVQQVIQPLPAPQPVPVRPRVASAQPPGCLSKDYLSGVVLFKDLCTKEWAMIPTNITPQTASASNAACLSKEYLQAGVVLFKDACTNEMAMNPPAQ